MSDTLYLHSNTAIVNFNQGFPSRSEDILNSDSFKKIITLYVKQANSSRIKQIQNLINNDDMVESILELTRQLYVYSLDAIQHPLLTDRRLVSKMIDEVYVLWRDFQRCSVLHLGRKSKSDLINFIDTDTQFNNTVLRFYRGLQEKVQGRKNKIYRQLKAGTNAAITLREKETILPQRYAGYKKVHFIDSVLLHSPLILHPKTNKREGHFQETMENPIEDLYLDKNDFYCYPAKIGTLLAFVYFHKDFVFSGISLSNLFELATTEEIQTRKPDIMIVFGEKDKKEAMDFYIDKENDMVVAKISHQNKISYFGYMKKIMLTTYNVYMMSKGWLPIHGSMVNIYLNDNTKIGVAFMGDSGAGKSEIIEELSHVGADHIAYMDVIFDDMGVFHSKDGKVVAQGTEVGAFVRLDDLDRGLPYQQMDRSIFMNPESHVNARGRRMAMATTHEVGLSTSYFANPFGPLQQQDVCDPLIDQYFELMDQTNVKLGQVYTNLGVSNKEEDALKKSAQALLDLFKHD